MIKKVWTTREARNTNQKQQKLYGAKRMQLSKHSHKLNAKKITGQGMSEYLIIVGLIAVAGIAAMGFMGSSVRTQLGGMAQELAGGDAVAAQSTAVATAGSAVSEAQSARSLSSYAGANSRL